MTAADLGVMGGTFDPIHLGHLAVAEEAREVLGLDRILFVPASQPPHKPAGEVTPIEHRLAMVELAIADNPAFELSRVEVDRPGPSFTVDTVERLAATGDRLTVILSAETFAELPTWHEPERLFEAARVAVAPRWGYPAPDPEWLAEAFPGREILVSYLEGPRLGVSSTALRARVAAGRSIRYLVPAPVEAYIAAHHLYAPMTSLARRPASP
ncbi:MAG: nicotinate (nicotinamide) nucleotide adenylyltransferase [Chloroflexi bacterium]|nr:MAG: nicotinate (nicotinamide) nucleotide adenylyltransferase [Chloroflexota bacterium]